MNDIERLYALFAAVPDGDEAIEKAGGRIAQPESPISGIRNVDGIKMPAEEFEADLRGFSGSTEFFRWSALCRNSVLTEGTQFLAESAQCYWLMDLITSVQELPAVRQEEFQVWYIRVHDGHEPPPKPWPGPGGEIQECSRRYAWVWASDGRGSHDGGAKLLYVQFIPYTDFPLGVAQCPYPPPPFIGESGLADAFKLYVARNELGGITILLPSEY